MAKGKKYVELFYNKDNKNFYDFKEIEDDNPLIYMVDDIKKFRLCKVDDEQVIFTPWLHNGVRIDRDSFLKDYLDGLEYGSLKMFLRKNANFQNLILYDNKEVKIMADDDQTFYEYLEEALGIKRNLGKEFLDFKRQNANDDYNKFIFKRVCDLLKSLQLMPLEEVKQNIIWLPDDGNNYILFQTVIYFSQKGEELKEYINANYNNLLSSNLLKEKSKTLHLEKKAN